MREVYYDLLPSLIYRWVAGMRHATTCPETSSVHFYSDQYHGQIQFYDHNLIELMIEDVYTANQVYYLHFEMIDMKMIADHIQSFFRFLSGHHKETTLSKQRYQKEKLKILLSCSVGLTSSYFADLMKQALCSVEDEITIDAVSYLELDRVEPEYDIILLAPQIAYKYPELKEKYGCKLMKIDTVDFATGNVRHVLNEVLDVH